MTDERWLPVVGFEGFYEVSDRGNVRSVDRDVASREQPSGFRRLTGKPVAQSIKPPLGYRFVKLCRARTTKNSRVNVLVLEAFTGHRPDGLDACHNDGDTANNALTNLRWDSRSQNNFDRVAHGRHPNAEKVMCRHEHLLQFPNLAMAAWEKHGRRQCLACSRAQSRAWDLARRGRPVTSAERVAIAHEKYAVIMAGVTA